MARTFSVFVFDGDDLTDSHHHLNLVQAANLYCELLPDHERVDVYYTYANNGFLRWAVPRIESWISERGDEPPWPEWSKHAEELPTS